MAQRRHHYECAFESYLRARRIPYVSVDEARKALLPDSGAVATTLCGAIKSFDFVVYGADINHLIDVKGRKAPASRLSATARLESWVTEEDVESLRVWQSLFGAGFQAGFVFIYWCEHQPPDALFQEVLEHRGRWYAMRTVSLADYESAMKSRSRRWRTVDLPGAAFERLSRPFHAPAFARAIA